MVPRAYISRLPKLNGFMQNGLFGKRQPIWLVFWWLTCNFVRRSTYPQ
jgi:hypothetical protein